MRTFIRLCLCLMIPLFFIAARSQAQDLTGIWRGYFMSQNGDQYKYEMQLSQTHFNITGVSYSYLDTRFYGKATLKGNYNKNSPSALINETKTVELRMAGGSVACIMKCIFTYERSGKEEFLEGSFSSIYEKDDPASLTKKGGNCGGGKVFLRKVATSDFYVEPFLKNRTTEVTPEKPLPQKPVVTAPSKKPAPETKPHQKQQTEKNPVAHKSPNKTLHTLEQDTVHKKNMAPLPDETKVEKPKVIVPPPPVTTRARENALVQTINVSNEEIHIRLYDNGEVDGDTVSVYLDGKPLLLNKGLSTVPITLTVKLNDSEPEHALIMYAENMGRIPPNTSLMIIQDGDKRYQVNITSTEQKNAMVRLRYQKKTE